MMMVPSSWQGFIQNTIAQVENGTLPMSRINDAVTRILRVKLRAGFTDSVRPSNRQHANNSALIGAPAHRAVARKAVRESLVLLKNSQSLLPLDRNANVLVCRQWRQQYWQPIWRLDGYMAGNGKFKQ